MDGRKMAKSAGNFQRVTELVERGLDPLAFRYLRPDIALLAEARVLGPFARRGRGGARVAARRAARRSGRRRRTGRGPRRPPLRAGRAGDRPVGIAAGVAGHGSADDGFDFELTDRATSPAAPLSAAGRALHDRFVAAIDDDLDMPVALALLREILRAPIPDDERRWLILDADLVLGLDLDRVWTEAATAAAADDAIPAEAAGLLAERGRRPSREGLRPRRCPSRRARGPRLGRHRRPVRQPTDPTRAGGDRLASGGATTAASRPS